MAVQFPSDIIMDVARAADPASAKRVESKLANAAEGAGFSGVMEGVDVTGGRLSRVDAGSQKLSPAKEFEAVLVSKMVEDMMGEDENSYFGGGFAGGVWKSMMAEKIAQEIVKTSDFGVASKISQYFVRRGEDSISPISGINDAENTPTETRALDAANRTTDEISRDFLQDMMTSARLKQTG